MSNDIKVETLDLKNFKYLTRISMISISILTAAMAFTYHIIKLGNFLAPGGVIAFSITYVLAAIVAEVYGYKNARNFVFSNFICIAVFNLTTTFLLHLPVPQGENYHSAYNVVFGHSFLIMFVYCSGFFVGDLVNTFAISKLKFLTNGRYFIARIIGSSSIGHIVFSIIAIPLLYAKTSDVSAVLYQFFTTVLIKVCIISILAFPSKIIVSFLKRNENVKQYEQEVFYNPFK